MMDANTGRIEDGWNVVWDKTPVSRTPTPGASRSVHTPRPNVRTVLVVADEWFPARGGLSALNRYLCQALAAAGVEVFCLVPRLSGEEQRDMEASRVRPIIARPTPGTTEHEALTQRPSLPDGVKPDLIVGHGRVTGPAAKVLAESLFDNAPRIHLVHMSADEIEWHKLDGRSEAGTKATERSAIELGLAAGATAAVPVGPRLCEWIERDLDDGTPVVRLDPGFDPTGPDERPVPKGARRPLIMIMGRMEDARLKGVKLAARAIRHARELAPDAGDWELLVRGAPAGTEAETREKVIGWIGHRTARVTVRAFDADVDTVRRDLRRASLLLMPSLVEGYGLVGHEAITEGTPTLVSEHSGLGMLLEELAPRESRSVVVPILGDMSKDAAVWGHCIAAELRDRPASFARAAALRRDLAARWTWANAVARILSAL